MFNQLTKDFFIHLRDESRAWEIMESDGTFVVTDQGRTDPCFNNPMEVTCVMETFATRELANDFIALTAIQHALQQTGLLDANA